MPSNCIVTGGSRNDVAPMGVLLLNLKRTQSWIDHVVIYHDGISGKNQSVMRSIMPVEFISYRFPGNMENFNEIIRYVYTPMIFCKYECLKLLERFDRVVWTDYDVLFLQDVPEIIDFHPYESGARFMKSQPTHACCHFSDQIIWSGAKTLSQYCPLDSLSVFTNLMAFSRQLSKASELYESCIHFSEQFGQWLSLPEQAVFDIALHQMGLEITPISWDYAVRPIVGQPIPSNAKIIHAISQPKFWNGLHHPQWDANYAEWLAMGGTPWKPLSRWCQRNIRNRLAVWIHKLFSGSFRF